MPPTVFKKLADLNLSDADEDDRKLSEGEDEPAHQKLLNSSGYKRLRRRSSEFTAVIMAAGNGSRMFELTNSLPKCMVPVANMPMIWYPVNFLVNNKFEEIYIVVRMQDKDRIETYLTSHFRRRAIDVHFEFVCIDDDSEFGTADSLRLLIPKTRSDLLVISCDLITNISLHNLANVHRANNAAITCLVAPCYVPPGGEVRKKRNKNDEKDFIGIDPADDRMIFVCNEKDIEDEICIQRGQLVKFPHMRLYTNLLDTHLYLISRSALNHLANHPSISMVRCELLPLLVRKQLKQIANTEPAYSDRIYTKMEDSDEDVKNPEHYFDILRQADSIGCYVYKTDEFCVRVNSINNYVMYNRAVSDNLDAQIPPIDASTCDISKMTQVGKDSRVAESVTIDVKCSVKRSYIGSGTKIGGHCKLVDCVIMNDVTIEDNVSLINCIVCPNVMIRTKSTLKECRIGSCYEVAAGSDFTKETLVKEDHNNMMSFNICNSELNSENDDSDSYQLK